MCLRLVELGHDVHVAAAGFAFGEDTDLGHGVTYHDVSMPRGANPLTHLRAARSLRRLVDELQPDLVDVHYSAAMLSAAVARTRQWPRTTAIIQGLRFTNIGGLRGHIERLVECWAARRMDEAIVLTTDDLTALRENGVTNASELEACGFGCDLERFDRTRFSAADKAGIRAELGLTPDEFVVIYVGRFVAFKGFDVTVRAFNSAVERVPDMRLLLCGVPDSLHPSGLADAEQASLDQNERVSKLGWVKTMERVLVVADLCVFPSTREGMPVNLMEASSMGLPIITCDSRGCREVVRHEVTGFVLPPQDSDALADAMVELSQDRERLQRMQDEALASRARFDRRRFIDERVAAMTGERAETGHAAPSHAAINHATPNHVEPGHVEPGHARSGPSEPENATPSHAAPTEGSDQ